MIYLTIAWCLISLPMLLVGGGIYGAASPKYKTSTQLSASAMTILPLWWGVYFLIRWWAQ